MMKYEIRELSIGKILDQAIKVIMDNLGVLVTIAFALQFPLAIFSVVVMAMLQFDPGGDPAALQAAMGPMFFIMMGVIMLLSLIVTPITNAAMVNAIADAYLGKKPTVGGSFSRAISRFGPLIWTWILVGLATMGGLMLCVLPGILCMIWFALATQVVVLEPLSGVDAMKRSKDLMKGNFGKWFVLMLLVGAITVGISTAGQMIGQLAGNMTVAQILSSFAQIFMGLFGGAVLVIFYFSARCSNENFDLELLASSFGEAASNQSPFDEDGEEDDDVF